LSEPVETRALAALIARCLRRDPKDRITIRQARQFLANLNLGSASQHWPLRSAS
jgi:PIN domain nuclease of toxin-antitoxin system